MAIVEDDYVPTETVTAGELRAALDSLSSERMGMTADGFIAALEEGQLDPYDPTVAHLAILARLIT